MSEQNEKAIFVGGGIEKFDGNLIEISVCLSKIQEEAVEAEAESPDLPF